MKITRFNTERNVKDNLFWKNDFAEWESITYDWLHVHSDRTKILLDIGAWIGPISLFCNNHYKKIYAIEPDKVAFEQLEYNVVNNNLNNIVVFNEAIYNDDVSEITIGSETLGDSNTRINCTDKLQRQSIGCKSLSKFLTDNNIPISDVGLIKIDVEGSEVEILKDTVFDNIKIPICLSIHPPFIENFRDNTWPIQKLFGLYNKIVPNFNVNFSMNASHVCQFNEFYTVMMLNI